MDTPWGQLNCLDLADHELAYEIIAADKHQLVEGLVVECLFDQYVANVPSVSGEDVIALDVDSVVVDTMREKDRWVGFVWARHFGPGLGRYLLALEQCLVTYLVTFCNGEFMVGRVVKGKWEKPLRPLPELMLELSGGRVTPFKVDASVRDKLRQKQAFWGYISDCHKDRLGERVTLSRILINCGIQPYFRAVWNLDRIFVIGNDIWLFEIKHKFPMNKGKLYFGINDGELGVLGLLANAGIRCLHNVIVKPCWSKEAGTMYLINSLNTHSQIAIIAAVLDQATIAQAMRQQSGRSGPHTSINGSSNLNFKSLAASNFKVLGTMADSPQEIARQMSNLMKGEELYPVNDQWLHSLRLQKIEQY